VGKEVILVVDDNEQLADFVAKRLLPSLGFEARIAYNGKSALESLRSSLPSLVLLDLELPDMSGLDILRRLAIDGISVPTILVTAHGSEQIAVDAFRLGVQDYLIKPVETDQLDGAITRSLAMTRLRQEADRLNTQLKEQVSWLQALSKVGQSLTSTLNLSEVLMRIVESGVLLTQAEEGFLALLDSQSGQLFLRAVKNIDEDKSKTIRLLVNDPLVSEVLNTNRPLRTSSQDPKAPIKVSTGFFVKSLLHVPILSKGKPLGVLSVDNRVSKAAFTANDEAMLTSLADFASVAIENASLFQQAQHEITERKRVEQALRESEERYALAVEGANDGIWDWNLKANLVYYSARWKSMLGYDEEEITNSPLEWLNRIHPEDAEKVKLDLSAHIRGLTSHFENEHRIQHKDGSHLWMLSRGIAVRDADGVVSRIAGSQTDISVRKAAEAKLQHDAFYERLTGLPNRALFMDRLKSAIERVKRRKDYVFAVLFLDLDQFKNINDTFGHPIGDQLLIAVGTMLRNNLRATDTVARLGGDEFVILLEDLKDANAAASISEWILKKFSTPIRVSEHEIYVTTSIGIVLSTLGYNQPEDILRDADIAMYAAKARGKATFEVFNPSMRENILTRVALEADLRQAARNGQLTVYYQPIISFITGQLIGFEALVRWMHPDRGLIEPPGFLNLAQETGLIITVDRWVIEEACRQTREWQLRFQLDPPFKINVNVNSKLIGRPDTVDFIKNILQNTGLYENSLILEITESVMMDTDESVANTINELRKMGIEVHIDDFGTGYSSLAYLRHFPVNALKIDRSFIQQIGEKGENTEIARTIIGLAKDLGLQAFAEGVETRSQLAELRAMGCDYGQGFLFSTPMDKEKTALLLEQISEGEDSTNTWKEIVASSSSM
jgi:diguanylate cyclase (GGDEF)-like protein/PAS domain S-box-containing protein